MKPEEVLSFWFEDGPDQNRETWFESTASFDESCGAFSKVVEDAGAGRLNHWAGDPKGVLALCILLDQLPRNLFRGRPAAFAWDERARAVAREAVARGLDRSLTLVERLFVYLPFEHSEDMADQDESVRLFTSLAHQAGSADAITWLDYAHRHRDVIRRFGRFPHRNAILGRVSTPEEQAYLATPGAGFS